MRSILLALVLASPLAAQPFGPSNTEGLFVHLALDAQSLFYNEDDFDQDDSGGGISVRLGYGFSPVFTLYLGVSGATVDGDTNGVIRDEYRFAAGEIGARLNLNRGSAWRPYLDVSLRGVTASDDDVELEFTGGGVAFGGGLAYFVSPTVALDAAVRIGGGEFSEVDFGVIAFDLEESGYGEGRFSLGITAYPFR
ncbi:outer membrane beta-barrel protein [Rubrivirga sp.]|uniref:outer membrane beta-barrel protein n=1 Tax=Rubrivirga sp. TaxID=1885344 RepID=UPI003C77FFBE